MLDYTFCLFLLVSFYGPVACKFVLLHFEPTDTLCLRSLPGQQLPEDLYLM